MAADVKLAPGTYWSTSGGLFGYIIERLALVAGDPKVAAELRLVDQANLGVVDLGDFGPQVRRRLLSYLADGLVNDAATAPPPQAPDWDTTLSALGELAVRAQAELDADDQTRAAPDEPGV